MRAGMGTRRNRARLLGAISLIVIAGCAAPATTPEASETTTAIGSFAATPAPSEEPSQTLEPSTPVISTGSPTTAPSSTPAPTPRPTPRPTATPKPEPTLNWGETPIGMGVTPDPASIGKSVTVEVVVAKGPTCVLKVKYPSGSAASLPKPTRPDSQHWVWKWTISQTAGFGTAKVTVTCTYAGVARGGSGTFTISGWSINATFPSTLAADAGRLYGQVTILGVWQRSSTGEQRMNCILTLVTNAGTVSAGENVFWYTTGQGPFDLSLPVGQLGSEAIGPATWTLACTNFSPDPDQTRKDSGTIEIT